jgi:DNA-binding MarR family transcriptional regulator
MHLAAPIGVTPDEMAIMAGLDKADLLPAIKELVHRSLLDVRGSPWDRRYAIHALTRAFLQTEIIHWPEDFE